MKKSRVEKHRIDKQNQFWKFIDNMCWKSKNMYNYGNYIIRQEFIQTSKDKENGLCENAHWIKYNELFHLCKDSESYKDLGNNVGQATLRKLDKNWKAFFSSIKDWSKNPSKYKGRPKMPQYLNKEHGRYELCLDNNKFKIIDGHLYFCWKPMKIMNNIFRTNIRDGTKLIQCRFVPKGNDYILEIVYEIEVPETENNQSDRIAAIDLGIDNLMTITTNCNASTIVINGRPLKAINQYYNKEMAKLKSDLKKNNDMDWSNHLQSLTAKRNNKVDDYIHKSSKKVVDWCIDKNIDTLVCGHNKGWKQESDMGKKVNQKFVQIPFNSLIQKLEYKCETVGIKFIQTEEGYTSGTSFLDGEEPIKKNYDKSRRVHRGLFVTKKGVEINADVNGSYQIMKKVFPDAFANGIEGVDLHPVRLNI